MTISKSSIWFSQLILSLFRSFGGCQSETGQGWDVEHDQAWGRPGVCL